MNNFFTKNFKNKKIFKRIFYSFGGQSFLFINRILEQFIILPALIKFWGASQTGDYLTLFSLSIFIQFLTWSYFSYFSNDLIINYKSKKAEQINDYINNYINAFFRFSLYFNFIVFILVLIIKNLEIIKFASIANDNFIHITLIFFVCTIIDQQTYGLYGPFRFLKKIYLVFYFDSILIFAKLASIFIFILSINFTLFDLAIINLTYSIIRYLFLKFVLSKNKIIIRHNIFLKIKLKIGKLKNIFSFFITYLSDYLILHFFVILISIFLGSYYVTVYIAHRIFARLIIRISDIMQISFREEAGISFKSKNFKILKNIVKKSVIFSLIIISFYFLLIFIFGDKIFSLYSKNQIEFSRTLFVVIFISVFFENFKVLISSLLYGTNNHIEISKIYFFTTIISTLLFIYLLIYFDLYYAILSIIFIQLTTFVYTIFIFFKKI